MVSFPLLVQSEFCFCPAQGIPAGSSSILLDTSPFIPFPVRPVAFSVGAHLHWLLPSGPPCPDLPGSHPCCVSRCSSPKVALQFDFAIHSVGFCIHTHLGPSVLPVPTVRYSPSHQIQWPVFRLCILLYFAELDAADQPYGHPLMSLTRTLLTARLLFLSLSPQKCIRLSSSKRLLFLSPVYLPKNQGLRYAR